MAADADGDFVVAWQSNTQDDGSTYGVFARRFSSAGSPLAGEFQVNTYTTSSQFKPSVTTDAGGDFVVAWMSPQDGPFAFAGLGIFARRFSRTGPPLAIEFQVNTFTLSHQYLPSVAASASGDFVVAWLSYGQDGSSWGVFAQRFAFPEVLDIDGNGLTDPLTDGLLVLRRFFDFSGTNLTANAVGDGCKRCNAAAIEP